MTAWAWQGTCCRCKVPMAMDDSTYQALQRSGATFYCPYGHTQHFTPDKTEAERLQEQLDAERRRRQRIEQDNAYQRDRAERAERRVTAYKGQATRLRNRAKAGVCPCCNRTVSQLARHMATEHPDFSTEPDPVA